MKAKCGLTLAMAAGCLATGSAMGSTDNQAQPGLRAMKAWPVANIYYNVRTGERIATPINNAARNTSNALWISDNTDPCATGGTVGIIDDPDTDGDTFGDLFSSPAVGGTFPLEGTWNNFWGDIAADSVVDCLVVAYGILAPDTDTNGDSIGDGIVGYDMTLTFSDADDGFGADFAFPSGRACLYDLTITTIPGALPGLPPGYVAVYLLTLDFAGSSPAPSLVFELGDSDGVDDAGSGISGGAIYGVPTFLDVDGDTLGDFSFSMRFDQSALAPAARGANGFLSVADFLGNPGDTAPSAPATGLFDALDIYTVGPSCPPTSITGYIGTFFFGGFTCATGTPYASSYQELYGPGGTGTGCSEVPPGACNGADLAAPAGTLDFSDVIAFLTSFGTNGCASDLAAPTGTWDFSDVIAFLTLFGGGCP